MLDSALAAGVRNASASVIAKRLQAWLAVYLLFRFDTARPCVGCGFVKVD